ncbi:MAG: hypothetical protein WC346_21295 [Methanogenium sp.]|jgi:hypothetical protein
MISFEEYKKQHFLNHYIEQIELENKLIVVESQVFLRHDFSQFRKNLNERMKIEQKIWDEWEQQELSGIRNG